MLFSFDIIENMGQTDPAGYKRALLPLHAVLVDIPALAVTTVQAKRLIHGQRLSLRDFPSLGDSFSEGTEFQALCQGKLIAIVSIYQGGVLSKRGFNLPDETTVSLV